MTRYTIRGLLLLTAIIAIFIAVPLHHARQQREAREWVASQRGHSIFKYGYTNDEGAYLADNDLPVPTLAVKLFGIDAFDPVTAVIFDCDELVNFQPLTGIRTLEHITVNIEMADDIDFRPLKEIPRLRRIHFTKWAFLSPEQSNYLRDLLPDVEIVIED